MLRGILLGSLLLSATGWAGEADGDGRALIYHETFEGGSARQWSGGKGDRGGVGEVSVRAGAGRDGSKALAWEYNLEGEHVSGVYSRCRAEIKLPGQPRHLKLWVHGDNSGLPLISRLRDATGRVWQREMARVDWEGWRELSIPLEPKGHAYGGEVQPDKGFLFPLTLAEFTLDCSSEATAKAAKRLRGQLRFDELRVYADAVDVEDF